jgi:hypothetical protein
LVGPQAAQAVVDRPPQRSGAGALEPGGGDRPVRLTVGAPDAVLVPDHPAALGGEEDVVPPPAAGKPPAQQFLALTAQAVAPTPPHVAVRGVQKGAIGVQVPIEYLH